MKLETLVVLYGFYPNSKKKHGFWETIDKYVALKKGDWQKAYHLLSYEWRHDDSLVKNLYNYLMNNYPYPIPKYLFFSHSPYWLGKHIQNNKKKYYRVRKISGLAVEEFQIEDLANKWLRDYLSGESFFEQNREYFTKNNANIFLKYNLKYFDDDGFRGLIKQYFFSKIYPVKDLSIINILTNKFENCFNHPIVNNFLSFIHDNIESIPHRYIIQDFCDYLKTIVLNAKQPNFSFKGRTWRSLTRLSQEWHTRIMMPQGYIENSIMKKWNKFSSIKNFKGTINNKTWEIKQITTGKLLYDEGEYMHHCCFSYINSCINGDCAIFSLRCYNETKNFDEKSATIEISQDYKLIQARGRFNKLLDEETKVIIDQWKKENGIKDYDYHEDRIELDYEYINERDNYYEYLYRDDYDYEDGGEFDNYYEYRGEFENYSENDDEIED
jgi:hypothetical protein